jgi:hypothetical protein
VRLQGGLAELATHLVTEIDGTMPRRMTSSANSLAVQWVIGRPDFSGGSQATARMATICSGGNLPGGPGRGSSPRTCSMARRKAAWLWVHSIRMSRSQALAQRRRQVLTCGRDSPTSVAISPLPCLAKAKRMMAARWRSCEEAVGALRIV